MAFKEVQDLGTDTVIALGGFNKKTRTDNAQSIEGYYLGSREVSSPKSKNGLAKIHVFQTPKGNVGVWGKTDLDRKLGTVPAGTMTIAKFDKMVPSKNGEMYSFKVLVDADNTIEVSAAASTADTTSDSDYAASTTDDVDTTDVDDTTDVELELAAAKAKQARVQALLSRNKTK